MLDPRLLERLDTKKRQLDELRPHPTAAVQRLKQQILVEWIYNSNAIEGNTITLHETKLILETGLTIGGKSLREHFEVINHRDAIEYVEALVDASESISPFHVRQIHKLVLTRIDEESAGTYRKTQVLIAGAAHTPPESWLVPSQMDEWGQWLTDNQGAHPVELAAQAHHRLVAIHPFIDGNGRTARLVMNLILMRAGYPPTVILRTNRQQYYRVLSEADAGKTDPLVNFVGRAVERSLSMYLEACTPRLSQPAENDAWIPLRDAAKGTQYSQEYLSLLARLGRIEAIKRGKAWYTTRQAVQKYIDSVEKLDQ